MQRSGLESESKHLSLERETPVPPVVAAGDHLPSSGKNQQDFSVLAPFMCEQSLPVFRIGDGIINFGDGPLNGNYCAFPWEGKQVFPVFQVQMMGCPTGGKGQQDLSFLAPVVL